MGRESVVDKNSLDTSLISDYNESGNESDFGHALLKGRIKVKDFNFREYSIAYSRVYKEIDDVYHEFASHQGMSDSAFEILYSIAVVGEGCTQKEICELCCTRKQTINSAIQKMAREGLLRLEHGKGREMCIFLTEKGKKVEGEKIFPVVQCEARAFNQMNQEEREEFLRLNEKFLEGLKANIKQLE